MAVSDCGSTADKSSVSYTAARGTAICRTSICRLRWARCRRAILRHSDVLAMTGWMGPRGLRRWITFPGNEFRLRRRFIDDVGFAHASTRRDRRRSASSSGEAFTAFVFGHAQPPLIYRCADRAAFCRHDSPLAARPAPGVAELDAWSNMAGARGAGDLLELVQISIGALDGH